MDFFRRSFDDFLTGILLPTQKIKLQQPFQRARSETILFNTPEEFSLTVM